MYINMCKVMSLWEYDAVQAKDVTAEDAMMKYANAEGQKVTDTT